MNVDTDTLRTIREYRISHDPLIPHPGKQAWLESTSEPLLEFVPEARMRRLEDAPVDSPIQKATWVETTVFCFTRSMDSAIDQREHLGVYQYCFDQMSQQHLDETFEKMMPSSMDIITTDQHRELAETFREFIATAQHKIFIEKTYDDLSIDTDGVPKAFWRSDLTQGSKTESKSNTGDSDSQLSLTDY